MSVTQTAAATIPTDAPTLESAPTYSWKNGKLFRSCRPLPWRADDDFAATLKRNGFNKYPSIDLGGEFEDLRLQVFERAGDSNELPHWLTDLTIGNVGYSVWVDDVADLLNLLEHVAPTIAAVAALSDRAERQNEEREQRRAEIRETAMWRGGR